MRFFLHESAGRQWALYRHHRVGGREWDDSLLAGQELLGPSLGHGRCGFPSQRCLCACPEPVLANYAIVFRSKNVRKTQTLRQLKVIDGVNVTFLSRMPALPSLAAGFFKVGQSECGIMGGAHISAPAPTAAQGKGGPGMAASHDALIW